MLLMARLWGRKLAGLQKESVGRQPEETEEKWDRLWVQEKQELESTTFSEENLHILTVSLPFLPTTKKYKDMKKMIQTNKGESFL